MFSIFGLVIIGRRPALVPGPARKNMKARTHILGIIACAMISIAPLAQGHVNARPARPKLEARIAELKAKTAVLVAAGRARLEALSPQQRLSAPPAIWRVPDALTEFK